MSDVPHNECEHDCDAESCHGVSDTNGPCGGCCSCLGGCVYGGPDPELARDRREVLAEMTRDAEPYADQVDVFGPPRTEPPSPAEAHEIMQRVTGQPQYPSPAEVADHVTRELRAQLAGARLRVERRSIQDRAADHAAIKDKIAEWRRRTGGVDPYLPTLSGDIVASPIDAEGNRTGEHTVLGHVTVNVDPTKTGPHGCVVSFTANGGKPAPGRPEAGTPVVGFRPPVEGAHLVDAELQQTLDEMLAEVVAARFSALGESIVEAGKSMAKAVEQLRRLGYLGDGPVVSDLTGDVMAPGVRRTTLVTCGRCGRDLFEQEADASQVVEQFAAGWDWTPRGEAVCKAGDHEGCQP